MMDKDQEVNNSERNTYFASIVSCTVFTNRNL